MITNTDRNKIMQGYKNRTNKIEKRLNKFLPSDMRQIGFNQNVFKKRTKIMQKRNPAVVAWG